MFITFLLLVSEGRVSRAVGMVVSVDRVSRVAGMVVVAYSVFLSYVGSCLLIGLPVPKLAWTYVWVLGVVSMALMGASSWCHERQERLLLVAALGGMGIIGGLMSQFPLVRSIAGFALTVAYWTGLERTHAYGPMMDVGEVRRRALWLSLAMLVMNVVSYLFLHAQ